MRTRVEKHLNTLVAASPVWIRHVLPAAKPAALVAAFFGGFVWDVASRRRIDAIGANIELSIWIVLLGLLLTVEHRQIQGRWTPQWLREKHAWVRLAAQFATGTLLSAYVVYYFKSASMGPMLLFMGLLVVLMVANEVVFADGQRLGADVALYAFCALSFLMFFIPVTTGALGPTSFVAALWGAMMAAGALTALVHLGPVVADTSRISGTVSWLPTWPLQALGAVGVSGLIVVVLLTGISGARALNLIPPVPLAITHAGAYTDVSFNGERFELSYEKPAWYAAYQGVPDTVRVGPHSLNCHDGTCCRVYVFTAVFAPSGSGLKLTHRWERYDPNTRRWKQTDQLTWHMKGGRGGGWRHYTCKKNVESGDWRVSIETDSGRPLSRVRFSVETSSEEVLQTTVSY